VNWHPIQKKEGSKVIEEEEEEEEEKQPTKISKY